MDIKINRSRLKILYTKDPKSARITEYSYRGSVSMGLMIYSVFIKADVKTSILYKMFIARIFNNFIIKMFKYIYLDRCIYALGSV